MPTTRAADRLRTLDADVWDPWIAAAFTGLAFVPVLANMSAQFGDLPRRPADWFALVLVLAQTLPLAVRHRWPAACLAVVGAGFAIHEALAYPPQFSSVTVYLALYSAGAHQERFRRGTAVVASAGYVTLSTVVHVLGSPDRLADFLVFYLLLAVCWALGAFVRQRRAVEADRRRLAAAAATAAERARIARELHDVVTHHVTAIVVQADATQFLAESPDRVVKALTTIGGTGRRALAELRYLLDVLEATGESATPRTAAEESVRDLVEQTRLGGQPVELAEEGEPPALPVAVRLAVYRVVQEGLTNAVKYAAGQPTVVRVAYLDGRVEAEVTNAAAPVPLTVGARRDLSGGRGLTGLRDRVGTLGGELTAGERPDGGFRLRAVIPVGDA
ncbi:sensor histidine kinase [Dactylosporangium sp. CA-092794]|uniref:sensor histidine kinase n=1 Tax=Dactylosporangium sp. CA-092794 TaxID=3239929 RepID=UPI003D8D1AFC